MPKKKKSNRFEDSDDEVPSIITDDDLKNANDQIVPTVGKKTSQQKKNKDKKVGKSSQDDKGKFFTN